MRTDANAGYVVLSMLVLIASGCTQAPPEFEPSLLVVTEADMVDEHREQIQSALVDWFGTPDEPKAPKSPTTFQLDQELLAMAAGPAGYVDRGDGEYLQRGLYRQHCASCHGITGNGMGPAAAMLAPYPRDFRPGVFKFKSTYRAAKPTDDDVRRVIKHGVPGTAMPSFSLLDDKQIDALVEYIKYLAIRGQVERELVAHLADEFDFDPLANTTDQPFDPDNDKEDRELVDYLVAKVSRPWGYGNVQVVQPDPEFVPSENRSAAEVVKSVAAGRELFVSTRAKCTDCHGLPGSAVIAKDYDDWDEAVVNFLRKTDALVASIERREQQIAGLNEAQRERGQQQLAHDKRRLQKRKQVAWRLLEPRPDPPRNLSNGVFHGGDELIDLFRRVHQGVAGTPMPAHGSPRSNVPGSLSEGEIWQLVDYLRSQRQARSL